MNPRDHFKRYYEDELEFLQVLGAEFASNYPDIAGELGVPGGRDPDVLQLLRGFAFLTGRIRQSLDAEFPHLLYPLLQLMHPHALRPTPSVCIVEFTPRPNLLSQPLLLECGARVRTPPLDGTVCELATTCDLWLRPITVRDVTIVAPSPSRSELVITLAAVSATGLGRLEDELLLHLSGTVRQSFGLYHWLGRSLLGVSLRVLAKDGALLATADLPPDALRPAGFARDEALLPYPAGSFTGYRHLQDYFAFPEKYLFYRLRGLARLGDPQGGETLELRLHLRPLAGEPLAVGLECVRVNCAPAVNLFEKGAEPLELRETRAEHRLRPAVSQGDDPAHYDIFGIKAVRGPVDPQATGRRNSEQVEYHPFFSFHRPPERPGKSATLYQVHLRPPVALRGDAHGSGYPPVETYLSFVNARGGPVGGVGATVSVELLVTNHNLLKRRLRVGPLVRGEQLPASVEPRVITEPSTPAPAPIGHDGLWRFLGHQLWSQDHLRDLPTLHTLLTLHDAAALYDLGARARLEQLLGGLTHVTTAPCDRVERLGQSGPPAVLRGTRVILSVDELRFGHPGQIDLFGAVLSHFLAETTSLNTFSELQIRGQARGLTLSYPARSGLQEVA